MASDYAQVHDFYTHMHEPQPALSLPHYHHHYQTGYIHANAASYELTGGVGVGASCALAAPTQHEPPQATSEVRKRKINHFGDSYEMSGCEAHLHPSHSLQPSASSAASVASAASVGSAASSAGTARKRKPSSYAGSAYDDDGTDDSRSTRTTITEKKQNHSEIEKRRRDKMNNYISELSAMVPMCGAMARKLDKLTVLRMAVQHLRAVRGAQSAGPLSARPRPACLSERELNALVLCLARDSFLLVVGCDRGRLLYVSASVTAVLHYQQSELLGQSLFDILHPKDVAKVKEQLTSSDLGPRERLIDAKTMLPLKQDVVAGASRLCPGARRSFFCRVKCRAPPSSAPAPGTAPTATAPAPAPAPATIKEEGEPSAKLRMKHTEKKYCVIQCTGYLKSWAPAEMPGDVIGGAGNGNGSGGESGEEDGLSCLVAVGRVLPSAPPAQPAPPAGAPPAPAPARLLSYLSRHATDGKFLFADQRVTLALGYLPQELLGSSLYELVCAGTLPALARAHRDALRRRAPLLSPPYRLRCKDGTAVCVQTHIKPFRNPWTKDVECLVANTTVLVDEPCGAADRLYDYADNGADAELQRLIESQVESHKIGATIAEQARRCSVDLAADLTGDLLLHDAAFAPQNAMVDSILGLVPSSPLSMSASSTSAAPSVLGGVAEAASPAPSPPLPPLGFDGNSEAAMAVIMSLLEADAGLGGPVNFSGLPWPLP